MSILQIIKTTDENAQVLRTKCRPVDMHELDSVQLIIDDMIDTIKKSGGLGLSAPQVGIDRRIFVLKNGMVCINPTLIHGKNKITSTDEGCLSLPGMRFTVKRFKEVTLKYIDRHGNEQTFKPIQRMEKVAVQHECDHLIGKLICDREGAKNVY